MSPTAATASSVTSSGSAGGTGTGEPTDGRRLRGRALRRRVGRQRRLRGDGRPGRVHARAALTAACSDHRHVQRGDRGRPAHRRTEPAAAGLQRSPGSSSRASYSAQGRGRVHARAVGGERHHGVPGGRATRSRSWSARTVADTDGDALPDLWEEDGVDADGDGDDRPRPAGDGRRPAAQGHLPRDRPHAAAMRSCSPPSTS